LPVYFSRKGDCRRQRANINAAGLGIDGRNFKYGKVYTTSVNTAEISIFYSKVTSPNTNGLLTATVFGFLLGDEN